MVGIPTSRISVPYNHQTHCRGTNTYRARTEERRDSGLHNSSREDAIPPLRIDDYNILFSRRIPLTTSTSCSRTIVLIHLDASTLSALTANPLHSPLSLPVSLLRWLLLSHCHLVTLSPSLQLYSLPLSRLLSPSDSLPLSKYMFASLPHLCLSEQDISGSPSSGPCVAPTDVTYGEEAGNSGLYPTVFNRIVSYRIVHREL